MCASHPISAGAFLRPICGGEAYHGSRLRVCGLRRVRPLRGAGGWQVGHDCGGVQLFPTPVGLYHRVAALARHAKLERSPAVALFAGMSFAVVMVSIHLDYLEKMISSTFYYALI